MRQNDRRESRESEIHVRNRKITFPFYILIVLFFYVRHSSIECKGCRNDTVERNGIAQRINFFYLSEVDGSVGRDIEKHIGNRVGCVQRNGERVIGKREFKRVYVYGRQVEISSGVGDL